MRSSVVFKRHCFCFQELTIPEQKFGPSLSGVWDTYARIGESSDGAVAWRAPSRETDVVGGEARRGRSGPRSTSGGLRLDLRPPPLRLQSRPPPPPAPPPRQHGLLLQPRTEHVVPIAAPTTAPSAALVQDFSQGSGSSSSQADPNPQEEPQRELKVEGASPAVEELAPWSPCSPASLADDDEEHVHPVTEHVSPVTPCDT